MNYSLTSQSSAFLSSPPPLRLWRRESFIPVLCTLWFSCCCCCCPAPPLLHLNAIAFLWSTSNAWPQSSDQIERDRVERKAILTERVLKWKTDQTPVLVSPLYSTTTKSRRPDIQYQSSFHLIDRSVQATDKARPDEWLGSLFQFLQWLLLWSASINGKAKPPSWGTFNGFSH